MVLNVTFNNISAISWLSVLLMEETGIPDENHRSMASRELTVLLVLGTDCTGIFNQTTIRSLP